MTTAIIDPSPVTRDQLKAALEMLFLMAEAVREAGTIPSGVLYSLVMHKTDLPGYERAVDRLVGAGLVVREANHVLKWVGPQKEVV